jgi:UDP-N-acetylglucosamine--N-acetylmuramyl-(pentapeptide) pyrophosphoryl-undecaprenol N-acetylglucosamine transferase
MPNKMRFVMAGGGTGGHVIPSIAVARELEQMGHEVFFVGTRQGYEARLVPESGFRIEWIEIGGLMRVGLQQTLRTLMQLPISAVRCWQLLKGVAGVFSMGGYVAAPVMIAAWLRRIPMVIMEPNAMPGVTNRRFGKVAQKVLVSFEEAAAYFPAGRVEVTGLPVRREFFEIPDRESHGQPLTVLVTGGSQGSRRLNQAVEEAWPLLGNMGVYLIHQAGKTDYDAVLTKFRSAQVAGQLLPFIPDMPEAFSQADIVVCRSGAGTVSELAAAGKPSILIPFPFAADDHQMHNARALEKIGAAVVVRDQEMSGSRLARELAKLDSEALRAMAKAARSFAKPGAARRAAETLEELACKPTPTH